MRAYNSGYAANNDSRFRTRNAFGRSQDVTEERAVGQLYGRRSVQLECRDLWRNDSVVRGAVNRFVDYSIWRGIWPQAKTTGTSPDGMSAADWNQLAEDWWREVYVPTADWRQINGVTLITHQELTVSHRILEGDCGFIMLANGQIQPIEGIRIATPGKLKGDKNVETGIRTAKGIVTGYYVCDRKGNGSVDISKYKFIKRENFIHCYKPGRFDQKRGVPDLAPAVNKIKDYSETGLYVLNKVKLDGQIITTSQTAGGVPGGRNRDHYHLDDSDDKDQQRVEKTEWGKHVTMRKGEDINSFDSKTPNTQFVPFMKHTLQEIASCLNIPYEYLMLIFTEGSYSSQRAAMLHAQRAFDGYHDFVISTFLNRLWNWRIAKAIKNGALPPAPLDDQGRSQWWRKEWSLVHMDKVDPQKQVVADKEKFNMGQESLSSQIRRTGRDRDDVLREKARDIRRAEEIAIEEGVDPSRMIETGTPGLTKVNTGSDAPGGAAQSGSAQATATEDRLLELEDDMAQIRSRVNSNTW